MHGNTQIFSGIDPLLDELVHQWKKVSEQSIADHGAFHVALAGGGTPRSFYARLANDDVRNSIAWDKVHIYFGDERYVSQDHVDSNYRMAYDVLLSKVNIPVSQIHAMVTPSLTPEQNAQDYVDLIDQKLPKDINGSPVFDWVLLGMGDDGHTASLFPGTEILRETRKLVAAQFVEKLDVWRVSLTYPTLNAAHHIVILVVGEAKAEILFKLSESLADIRRYPILGIKPQADLQWFLDAASARLINDVGL